MFLGISSSKLKGRDMLTIEMIKARAIPILERYGVNRAYLFGSFARGEQNQNSDIDILVEFKADAEQTLF
jgi:predicted nucleotidyltransferase